MAVQTLLGELMEQIKKGGIARSNRFRVTISLPSMVMDALSAKGVSLPEKTVSIMCQSVNHTGYNVTYHEAKLQTTTRKMPYNRSTNSDLELVFLCSEGLVEQTIMETWIKTIVGKDYAVEYFDNIVADLQVEHLDTNGNTTKTTNYIEAYPSVSGTVLEDKTAADGVLTLSVTFNVTTKQDSGITDAERKRSSIATPTLKFGANALPRAPIKKVTLFSAPNFSLLQDPQTANITKNIERIQQEIIRKKMNSGMAVFLLKNVLTGVYSAGISQSNTTLLVDYLNKTIEDISK